MITQNIFRKKDKAAIIAASNKISKPKELTYEDKIIRLYDRMPDDELKHMLNRLEASGDRLKNLFISINEDRKTNIVARQERLDGLLAYYELIADEYSYIRGEKPKTDLKGI